MASRIEYAVSVSPIFTHATGEGQADRDSIAGDFNKVFGGSGKVSSPQYGAAGATGTTAFTGTGSALLTTPTSCKGLFLRHTGVDEDDAATTDTATIIFDTKIIAILEAGCAFFLPSPAAAAAVTITISTPANQIKIEHTVFV